MNHQKYLQIVRASTWVRKYAYLLVNVRAYCVLFYRFNKVCLELLSYLKSDSHIINIPCLFGLYGQNIGPPGLGSGDRDATSHSVFYLQTIQHQR